MVVALWPADPPEIAAGFQIRFPDRMGGASYRPFRADDVVVPLSSLETNSS
jgi:hypothetical protein